MKLLPLIIGLLAATIIYFTSPIPGLMAFIGAVIGFVFVWPAMMFIVSAVQDSSRRF